MQNVQIRELKPGMSLAEAEQKLREKKDNYDTIGFTVGDTSYIAYGKGIAPNWDETKPAYVESLSISLDGKAGKVDFFEDEVNTFAEKAWDREVENVDAVVDWIMPTACGSPEGCTAGAIAVTLGTAVVTAPISVPWSLVSGAGAWFQKTDDSVVNELTQ
jgi:hypothetical protein